MQGDHNNLFKQAQNTLFMKSTHDAIYSLYSEMRDFKGWNVVVEDSIKRAKQILNKEGYAIESHGSGSMDYLFIDSFVKRQDAINSDFDHGWSIKISSISRKRLEEVAKALTLPIPKK